MFKFLNARYRHITGRHNIPYASLPVTRDLVAVDSIVIPCTGADFVEEALLSATFAERYATDVSEIVIVSDQPESAFGNLPPKTRIVTLDLPKREEGYRYKQIYLSRLVKLNAPLQARGEGVLMIDSDLNLLKMPEINMAEMHIYSSFRQGKMIAKLDAHQRRKSRRITKRRCARIWLIMLTVRFLRPLKRPGAVSARCGSRCSRIPGN